MVEIAAYLGVIFIDVSAGSDNASAVAVCEPYLTSIRHSEQLVIVWVDEADSSFGFTKMPVKPIADVNVDIDVVIAEIGIEPHEVGIVSVVKTVCGGILCLRDRRSRMTEAEPREVCSRSEELAVVRAVSEFVDDLVEPCFEGVGLEIRPLILPGGVKACAIFAEVGPKVPKAAGLRSDLL